MISFNFDIHNNMLTAMPTPVWKEIFRFFERLLKTLVAHPELKVEMIEGSTVVDTVQQTKVAVREACVRLLVPPLVGSLSP